MSSAEIIDTISPEIMAKIEKKDRHPFFTAFVTAHEGQGNPEILDCENQTVIFPRSAIKTVKNVVKGIIQAFRGHETGTNETEGRKALGQIVGQTEKEIDGKLSHISIFYHGPDVREEAATYDACSHEGIWNFKETANGLIALELEKLQAVGLLKNDETPPALAGSLKLGQVQAQKTPGEGSADEHPPGKGKEIKMDLSTLSYDEFTAIVKKETDRRKIWPSQIFNMKEIQEDREFSSLFKELEGEKEKTKTLESQINDLSAEKTMLMLEKQKTDFDPTFNKILDNKKLTDNTKAFIKRGFKKEKFEEFTKEKIEEFIKTQSDEFTELTKLITSKVGVGEEIEIEDIPTPPKTGEIDYTDEKQHPFFTKE